MYKRMLSIAQQWIFPPRCPQCKSLIHPDDALCEPCTMNLNVLRSYCYRCGIAPTEGEYCGQCATKPPPFQRFVGHYLYEKSLKEMIYDYKYRKQLHWANTLAKLLLSTLADDYDGINYPTAIIPVPAHTKKIRQRGFNPTLEICRFMSKKTNIPLIYQPVKRHRLGEAQSTLALSQRTSNVRGAFSVTGNIPSHVAIFDDVMTSGATVTELARTLRRHGAKKIDLWILARTLRIG